MVSIDLTLVPKNSVSRSSRRAPWLLTQDHELDSSVHASSTISKHKKSLFPPASSHILILGEKHQVNSKALCSIS